MRLQSLITLNIITYINMDLLKACIRILDILYWVNVAFKPKSERIEGKEFYNDAVNNNLDLKRQIIDWVQNTKVQVRNG